MNTKPKLKKFAIREVETVKTTASFYECRVCLPLCELFPDLPQTN
ncbi:hypothetical protein POL68_16150 [Stigmatella sp. ncwal1]|uniref:Uncharacterized protein n=1 Tax=Stigmatella ashevillensis TaxID=2995309 RepID=A0ABT5DA53_9BACT|nr:hypothetical protein [Stigmatella ashevillena]MDC0710008.1 hypothetical protein [Stigmatella ashevillena]